MNKVILIGNLTKDFDLGLMSNGKSFVKNGIAVRRDFKNHDGEYETDFINFSAFDKTADLLVEYFHKGDKIGLVGRWQVRKYQDKNNENRVSHELIVESFEFLNNKTAKTEIKKEDFEEPDTRGAQVTEDKDLPF